MGGAEGSRRRRGDGPARVAVVGAGAWGTTLAAILAQREPVTLLCHSPETAARIRDERRNEARLPGIDLPARSAATARSRGAAPRRRTSSCSPSRRRTSARRSAAVAPHVPATADLLSVVKGIERGTHLRMTDVIARGRGLRPPPDRRAVGAQPRARDRAPAAGVGRRRGRGRRRSPRASRSGWAAVGSGST